MVMLHKQEPEMNPDQLKEQGKEFHLRQIRQMAWVPIPILLILMAVFWTLGIRTTYKFPRFISSRLPL
jgi:hypothetical protein